MENSNKKTAIIVVLLIAAILGGVGFVLAKGFFGGSASNKSAKSSSCGYVQYRDLVSYVNLSGNVSSSDRINVTGETDLKVSKLSVKAGDKVTKGDVLCEFDTTQLTEEYNALKEKKEKAKTDSTNDLSASEKALADAKKAKEDNVKKAQNAINDAKAKRDQAYEDSKNLTDEYNNLVPEVNNAYKETIAHPDDQQIKARYNDLKARAEDALAKSNALEAQLPDFDAAVPAAEEAYKKTVKDADDAIRKAQSALDTQKTAPTDATIDADMQKIEEKLERCVVKAPQDGIVSKINVSVGNVPSVPTLMVIDNASQLVITGKISEDDFYRVSEGMNANIKTAATGDKVFSGRVNSIEKINNSEDGTIAGGYTVEIAVEDDDGTLTIGTSASVKIILTKSINTLSIPYDAVIGGENGNYYVFVATENSKGDYIIGKRNITKGFAGDSYLEITSGNLNQGDIVLTNPRGISDGDVISLDLPEN